MVEVVLRYLFPLLAVLVVGCSGGKPPSTGATADRIHALEARVEEQRVSSEKAFEAYRPQAQGKLGDLGVAAPDLLRQLPGVAEVEVLVAAEKPTHRIIHLRDWHYVPLDLYAIDLRQAAGRNLSEEEVGLRHRELMLEAELVQLEQEALLRCLVRQHGLKRVLAEGLTPESVKTYREVIEALSETDRRLAGLLTAHADAKGKNTGIDQGVADLLRGNSRQLVEYGAAGRMAVRGEVEVLPLDDERLLQQARPIGPDAKVRTGTKAVEARHDYQVKVALSSRLALSTLPPVRGRGAL